MDFRKLGNLLMLAGVAVLVAACIWWFSFYSSVVREIGQATGSAKAACSMWSPASTARAASAAWSRACAVLAGKTAYEPMLFWFGLAGLILGVLIRFTAKPSGAT